MTKTNFNRKTLAGFLIACIVLAIGILLLNVQRIEIITDDIGYENGGILKVRIRNISLKGICFSSCYPYYLEKRNGVWKAYSYQKCPHDDSAEKCCGPFGVKAFEISLPMVKKGTHRISVPICTSCQLGVIFHEGQRFYSNEFEIQ